MSFIYPRKVAITRPVPAPSGVGLQPYNGLTAANETPVAKGLQASIQFDRTGRPPSEGIPGDTQGRGTWKLFVRAKLGLIIERDIITDDLGNRYQVTNAYWNSLGYNCRAERLLT